MHFPHSPRVLAAAAIAAALVLSGCSSPAAETPEGSNPGDASAFPVTFEHVYGETTIEALPERVITIGWNAQDVAAALGVVPVAITDFTWGTVDTYLPWFVDQVDELGGELPEILSMSDAGEYDYEQILALDPDVILAPHSGITEEEYERLSDIAPTVAYTGTAWAADWREVTTTVGAALGQKEEAAALLDETNDLIEAQAAAHPEFEGKTFIYGWAWVEGDAAVGLYTNEDAREILIEQLGFTTAPVVEMLSASATEFYSYISLEELDTVDADLFIGWANSQEELDAMIEQPLISRWAPIADKKYYFMTTQELGWASSQPSVLSIPYSLDLIVPELAAALAK